LKINELEEQQTDRLQRPIKLLESVFKEGEDKTSVNP